MKLLIEIPPEFESHFEADRFEDSLRRLMADTNCLAGLYERETAEMLIQAFKKATPPRGFALDEIGYWLWDPDGMDWGIGAWKCSKCRAMSSSWWNTDKHNPMRCSGSKYCGNCGAKMEGALNAQPR